MAKEFRIKQLYDYLKDSGKIRNQQHFADSIHTDKTTVSQVLNGKKEAPANIFEKILSAYPEVNSGWLMAGLGTMLNDGTDPRLGVIRKKIDKSVFDRNIAKPTNSLTEGIPLLPVEAMAGALTAERTILEYECERYVIPIFKGADFLIPVSGDSMLPSFRSGDIVACRRVPMSRLFFQWNKVYVIDTDQGALIKRIKPGQKGTVQIVSDNESYESFELPVEHIHGVALVIGMIRLE